MRRAPAADSKRQRQTPSAWIVFGSDGAGGADLHVIRADGSGARVLTSTKWCDSAPDWEPTAG